MEKPKNILVICYSERSKKKIVFNLIKYLSLQKKDVYHFLVLDKNKKIILFLKKNKKKIIKDNFKLFEKKLNKYEFDWLLNLWSPLIFKKDFLNKFKSNLNLHPSYLPYNRGKDPYVWSILNEKPFGTTIHEMNEKIDDGNYYVRKKFKLKFPLKGFDLYEKSLIETKKLFIQNWLKIKNKKIKPKSYEKKTKLNVRENLKKINLINLNDKKNIEIKRFILRVLSQNFPTFKQQVKFKSKIFDIEVILKKNKKNKF